MAAAVIATKKKHEGGAGTDFAPPPASIGKRDAKLAEADPWHSEYENFYATQNPRNKNYDPDSWAYPYLGKLNLFVLIVVTVNLFMIGRDIAYRAGEKRRMQAGNPEYDDWDAIKVLFNSYDILSPRRGTSPGGVFMWSWEG